MKNRMMRFISFLLSLVIFISGLPAFAEEDFDIVVAEIEEYAEFAAPEETQAPDDAELLLEPVEIQLMDAPATEPTVEPALEPAVQPEQESSPEPVVEPAEEIAPDATSESDPAAEQDVQETATPEPELTPEPTEEILLAASVEPTVEPVLIQSVQELADAFGLAVEDLPVVLGISAEELAAMSPEELTAIHENGLVMNSADTLLMMSGVPEFTIDENKQLTAYQGNGEEVVVPDGVEAIGEGAFKNCVTITSIELPETVVSIAAEAFAGCEALETIKLPASVEQIADNAFEGCAKLNASLSKGSYAEDFCREKNISYTYFDSVAPNSIVPETDSLVIGVQEKVSVAGWTLLPAGTVDTVTYTTNSSRIATVNEEGLVTGKTVGKTVICLHTAGGLTAEIEVEVKKAPTSVSIKGLRTQIGLNEKLQLDYGLSSGSAGRVTFSSNNPAVVDFLPDNTLIAIGQGKAKVTAKTYNGKQKTVEVQVKPEPMTMELSFEELVLGVDDTRVLEYTLDAGCAGAVSFASSNPEYVQVAQDGTITAVGIGTADITVQTYNEITRICKVTVVSAPESIVLEGAREAIGVGEKIQLAAIMSPADAASEIVYKSSNTKVATVNASGLVTAKKTGKATIKATAYNGQAASFVINVKKAPTGVNLTADRKVIGVEEELQLGYKLSSGSAGAVSFASLNEDIAVVSAEGLLKGKAVGTATIEVRTYNNKYKRVQFEVKAAPAEITPERAEIIIGEGDSWTLGYALNDNSAGAVGFTSDVPSIAEIDAAGNIYAHTAGEATLTLESYNHVTANTRVTVVPAPIAIELSADRDTIGIGEKLQMVHSVTPAVTVGTIKYKTSNSKIATVNADGLVTAKKAGKATITVTAHNGLSATYTVYVKKAPTSVSLVSERKIIGVGEELQLGYKLSSGSIGAVSFRSLNEEFAAVTADGLLLGIAPGIASIEVKTYNGKYKRVNFEVKDAPTEITPDLMEIVIGAGDSWKLGYALDGDSAGAVSFTSDLPEIAHADASGMLYAAKTGEANITLETYNHVKANVHVTVVPAPESVVLAAERDNIGIGEKLQLNAIISPVETVGTIKYKSSNTKYATVDANGLVSGKRAGKATITATTYNGLTAKFVITVKKAPTSVSLVSDRKIIGVGEELQLGYKLSSGSMGMASFRSLNEDIAAVTADGLLLGIAPGVASIEVKTYNGKYKRVNFEVKDAPAEITPDLTEIVIGARDSWKLGYALDEGSAGAVSFTSDMPEIAHADASGMLYAAKTGEANITLETYNHVKANVHVTVVPAPESVVLAAERDNIGIGEKLQLNAIISPVETVGTIKYKSSNTKNATVDANGLVSGKRAGKATITATTYNGLTAKFVITVKKAPTSVSLVSDRKIIGVGEELQLGYKLSSGSMGTASFRSLNEDIAAVTADGLLLGIAPGVASIEVKTYNGKYKRVNFEVKDAPTEITSDLTEIVIGAGDSWTLGYTLDGDSAGAVSFVSDDPGVVVPDGSGKLYANATGEATITLETYNHVKATAHVTVVPEPEAIELSATRNTIGIGEKLQLASFMFPTATVGTIKYKSSNTKNVTVNADGIVSGKRAGKATITATTYNGLSAKFVVTVKKAPGSVSLVSDRKVIGVGEELQLGYKLSSGSDGAVSFRSLNEGVAIATADGMLKGIAVGTATIEVRTYNGKYKRVDFEVKAAPTEVIPARTEVSIGAKDSWVLAYALDENAAGGVKFASSNPAVADVDGAGKIAALTEGIADITITTYNDVSAVCRVTVVPEPVGIDLSMVPTTIGLNESVQIEPSLLPVETVSSLRYSSSKSSIVKVSADGVITGKKVGTASITVKAYNGVSETVKVRVVAAPKSIKLYTDRSTVAVGEMLHFTAELSKGSAGDYWFESSNESVIAVNPETGLAEAIAEGDAIISAVTYNKRRSEIQVNVLPEPTSISIVPGYAAIGVGDTIPLQASINRGSTGTYEFVSLSPEIASVGQYDGIVSARAVGTVKIEVRAYNGVSSEMELNVLPAPEHVDLIEPELNADGAYEIKIDKGSSYQIAVDKGDYTKLDLSFNSENSSIATVSSNGLISAKRAGRTLVTVSTYNGAAAQIWVTVQLLTDRYPVKTIMHAMGAVNGEVYSNSKEAFLANYANGHRFFEVDFSYTSDKKLVLWHSWKSNRVSSKLKAGYVPTYAEFMKQKVFDKYTPLDLAGLLKLMDAYPDAYFFMDTKLTGASDVRKQYNEIVSAAKSLGLEHVLDRMVVMIYNKTMYSVVNDIHPFRQYVFMMYKTFSKAPTASQVRSIASFCHANSIEYISMWDYWWKPSFMSIAQEYGLEVNLHTVNSTSDAKSYVEDGVSLITSDYLSIKGY